MLTQNLIEITSIVVGDRERTDLGNIGELMESLETFGQIVPIIVRGSDMRLVDGGRRYAAAVELGWTTINVAYQEELTDDQLKEMEIESNVRRKEMTWKERVQAIAKIHRMKVRANALEGKEWGQAQTGELLGVAYASVSYCNTVDRELRADAESPLHNAATLKEAMQMLMARKEDEAAAQLVKVSTVPTPRPQPSQAASASPTDTHSLPPIEVDLSSMFQLGSCINNGNGLMEQLADASVDHIITDPPYAIDMGNLSQTNTGMSNIDRVEATHQVEPNKELLFRFINESYRVLRPGGFCIFWYDSDMHHLLQLWGRQAGFHVQSWPLVWVKTHPCINQVASKNFTKATEFAMVMYKGNATLALHQPTNYIIANGTEDKNKHDNPFAKPSAVWRWLYSAVAIRGQTVLDPFAGECSSALAAIQLGLRPRLYEVDEVHYNKGVELLRKIYQNHLTNVTFK